MVSNSRLHSGWFSRVAPLLTSVSPISPLPLSSFFPSHTPSMARCVPSTEIYRNRNLFIDRLKLKVVFDQPMFVEKSVKQSAPSVVVRLSGSIDNVKVYQAISVERLTTTSNSICKLGTKSTRTMTGRGHFLQRERLSSSTPSRNPRPNDHCRALLWIPPQTAIAKCLPEDIPWDGRLIVSDVNQVL
ncbi:hypothetical protein EDC04DRAFT_1406768 [Pisolithus marmoratus]|nr:hypothetical protein EDC04DRAFT_1406768 [Pisolithus marmoratus]